MTTRPKRGKETEKTKSKRIESNVVPGLSRPVPSRPDEPSFLFPSKAHHHRHHHHCLSDLAKHQTPLPAVPRVSGEKVPPREHVARPRQKKGCGVVRHARHKRHLQKVRGTLTLPFFFWSSRCGPGPSRRGLVSSCRVWSWSR